MIQDVYIKLVYMHNIICVYMIQTQHKGKASKPTLFILNNISFVFSFLMIIGMKFKAKRRRVEKYFVYNFH